MKSVSLQRRFYFIVGIALAFNIGYYFGSLHTCITGDASKDAEFIRASSRTRLEPSEKKSTLNETDSSQTQTKNATREISTAWEQDSSSAWIASATTAAPSLALHDPILAVKRHAKDRPIQATNSASHDLDSVISRRDTKDLRLCAKTNQKATIADLASVRSTLKGRAPTQRSKPRRVVLGMTFNCEEWMLEVQLNELGDVVDTFIVLEAQYSYVNATRALCFGPIAQRNPNILKWSHKIAHVVNPHPAPNFKMWEAEIFYKRSIGTLGVATLSPPLADDDLILIVDSDEILSRDFVSFLKHHDNLPTVVRTAFRWSYYGFQWVNANRTHTYERTIAATWAQLRDLGHNDTHLLRQKSLNAPGRLRWNIPVPVGWHCSWCMPTAEFTNKVRDGVHYGNKGPGGAHGPPAQWGDVTFWEGLRREGRWFQDGVRHGCFAVAPPPPAAAGPAAGGFAPAAEGPHGFAPAYVLEHARRFAVLIE